MDLLFVLKFFFQALSSFICFSICILFILFFAVFGVICVSVVVCLSVLSFSFIRIVSSNILAILPLFIFSLSVYNKLFLVGLLGCLHCMFSSFLFVFCMCSVLLTSFFSCFSLLLCSFSVWLCSLLDSSVCDMFSSVSVMLSSS